MTDCVLSYQLLEKWSSPGVNVCCLNGVEEKFGHSDPFHVNEVRLEESFWGLEALPSDLNNPAVRELENREYKNIKALNQSACQYIKVHNILEVSAAGIKCLVP